MNDLHGFSSDRPIKTAEEDLFNRAKFAKDIAIALASWHGKDSLVVALHGEWGSGKSSIKNMAVSELRGMENAPDILEFSPWEWAAQDKITSAFFQEVSKSLGQKKEDEKLASIFKKYGDYLEAGKSIVDSFNTSVLPALYVVFPILSAAGIFFNEGLYKTISVTLLAGIGIATAFINWGKLVLEKFSNSQEKENSLTKLKSELTKLLSKRKKSLLVIMDDLDRLTTEQLRMVFQLVKANAEFPNVVFLLLFQRDLVEEKLNDGKQTGRNYLEKIIQVSFDIPKIESSQVHKALFQNLNKLLESDDAIEKMFEINYWHNVFHSSLRYYFENLRDVYRFSSTFSFHFSLFKGRKAFEVNPVDLIAIECLRVFEPEVYQEILSSKELFTGNRSTGLYGNQNRDKEKELLEDIIAKSTQEKSIYVKELLILIFPTINGILGNTYYGNDWSAIWLKSMRICHPSNFDKYFQFSIPSGEISHSELQELLELSSNREAFKNHLLALKDPNVLKNTLLQFNSFTDDIPLENIEPIILASFDICDEIDNDTESFLTTTPGMSLKWLAVDLIKRIDDISERGKVLLDCFKNSNGMSIIQSILMSDESNRDKSENDFLLADSEFSTLKAEFVNRLNYLSTNHPQSFLINRYFVSFLYRWKKWGDSEKVCLWIREQISQPESCIVVLRGFISKSSSWGANDYVAKIHKHIKLESIEDFVPVDKIKETTRAIDITTLSAEDQEALTLFNTALENRNNGISEQW